MGRKPKGRKLSAEVIHVLANLEREKLYSLSEVVKTVYPREHAMYDVIYRRVANYLDNHFPPDQRGHPYRYYGRTLQSRLTVEERNQARLPKRSKRRWHSGWLLACGLVLAGAAGATMTRLDPFGIFNTQGFSAAQKVVSAQEATTPEAAYDQAYFDYWSGNFQEAKAKAYRLLSEDRSLRIQADCYYLLGNIDATSGGALQALSHFEIAYEMYEELGSVANLYQVALEAARALIITGEYDQARLRLAEARAHFEEDKAGSAKLTHLGQYYLINKLLAMREQNFQAALAFAIERYRILVPTDSLDELVGAMTDLGFLFTVNGCTDLGIAFTNKAERRIFELGDERRYVWSQLNHLIIYKSLGYGIDQHTLVFIEDWSKMKGDSELNYHLTLALKIKPEEYADENCEDLSRNFSP